MIQKRVQGLKTDIDKLKLKADTIIKKKQAQDIAGFKVSLQNNQLDLNSLIEYACLQGKLMKHKESFKVLENSIVALNDIDFPNFMKQT